MIRSSLSGIKCSGRELFKISFGGEALEAAVKHAKNRI